MPLSEPLPVVIACPHCATRYQIPYAAIGAKGRNVLCAQCGQSWEAHAPTPRAAIPADTPLDALAEEALDKKFAAEARRQAAKREARRRAGEADAARPSKANGEAAADPAVRKDAAAAGGGVAEMPAAAKPGRSREHRQTLEEIRTAVGAPPQEADPAAGLRRQLAFSRRQRILQRKLPMARLRRSARLGALATLIVVVGGGIVLREPIVATFPELAAAYAAVGLKVNVVGLEFGNVKTLSALQQGTEVLTVEGDITSVAGHEVEVPQVLVTLLNPAGKALYQWSVTPKASELEPGEHIGFSTHLSRPPEGARDVKLSFSLDGLRAAAADAEAVSGDAPIGFANSSGDHDGGDDPHR